MAALIKHVLSRSHQRNIKFSLPNSILPTERYYATKKHYKQKLNKVQMPECRKLKSTVDSVATKGFLRCQKNYSPPDDVDLRLKKIFEEIAGPVASKGAIEDPNVKFELFNACYTEFEHSVPNSILHQVKTYEDLLSFYLTPVDSTLPLDKFKNVDLPPNLHIQYEPLRFHPEEDAMFNGQTAFPKSNTLVTGLRTRKKYKGNIVTDSWPTDI